MQLKFYSLKIENKQTLTPSSSLISFEVPNKIKSSFFFLPGQYVTLRIKNSKGITQNRCYSLCGDIGSENISICVKKVEGGIVSNFLCTDTQIGDVIEVSTPEGEFTIENSTTLNKNNAVFISAGSGITPIKSIIEGLIHKKYKGNIYLIFGNNNINEVIFLNYFKKLDAENHNFNVIHILKETPPQWTGEQGRLIIDNIKDLCITYNIPSTSCSFFISGPQGIINNSIEYLLTKEVSAENINTEKFFSDAPKIPNSDKEYIIKVKANNKTSKITAKANESLLTAIINAGINVDHSCRVGSCLNCTANLCKGSVIKQNDSALTNQQIQDGVVLTCQTYAQDNNVELDFDNTVTKSLLQNRDKLIGLGLLLALGIILFFSFQKDDSFFIKGEYNIGHEELECMHCHIDANGSSRQQIQHNIKHLFGTNESDVIFGKIPVGNNACISCHDRPNDQHPVHRFQEPKFKEARNNIHPEQCVSCHSEHNHKRVTFQETGYCVNCHEDVEIDNDPLDLKHDKLISLKLWNTCIQCHDFHGNHEMETKTKINDTIPLKTILEYFDTGKDPYSNTKTHVADIDSINKPK